MLLQVILTQSAQTWVVIKIINKQYNTNVVDKCRQNICLKVQISNDGSKVAADNSGNIQVIDHSTNKLVIQIKDIDMLYHCIE